MKILKQIDTNTRIVVKRFHLPAFGTTIILQRKGRYRWKNKAWTYPSTHAYCTQADVEYYLFWKENPQNHASMYGLAVGLFEDRHDERENANDNGNDG